ncbi:hypothetical protein SAMN02745126_04018 [Enhydrobacter aerosaccus]|uniref:Uncharacterized protein n=1 Tax=Enhydrobacter aerosaccus TaxID=225324 RepID=A0A1T4RPZ8_9HYPH|nr:hypothetical protein SAMN02745126_04018 [Enhydrobacter aerosaccus]
MMTSVDCAVIWLRKYQGYRFDEQTQAWFPPAGHRVSRADWEAIQEVRSKFGTGLLGNFSCLGSC